MQKEAGVNASCGRPRGMLVRQCGLSPTIVGKTMSLVLRSAAICRLAATGGSL